MEIIQSAPLGAMAAVIVATLLRGFAIRRETGDRPFAFLEAKGVQRLAGLSFAASIAFLFLASLNAAKGAVSNLLLPAATLALLGSTIVILAQMQMGRAWRIGVREGDAPQFITHGLFRFSRNPIFVGMMLIGLASAMASDLWWAWGALAVFVGSCIAQVRLEEVHLERSFGKPYREFRTLVPRWLGFGIRRISVPHELITLEMAAFNAATTGGDVEAAWRHLERAHIISQPYLVQHLASHYAMFKFAMRQRDAKEIIGQLIRLALAPLGALTGRIPLGNTGRSNVSAFKPMPIPDDLSELLRPKGK